MKFDGVGVIDDVWILSTPSLRSKHLAKARKMGAEPWTYDCVVGGGPTKYHRLLYGFVAYREKLRGVGLWAYYSWSVSDENGAVNSRGRSWDPRWHAELSHVNLTLEGPESTIGWEGVREGTEDYRTLKAVLKRIEASEKRNGTTRKTRRLRAQLKTILNECTLERLTDGYPSSWGFARSYDWNAMPHMTYEDLEKKRLKLLRMNLP